RHTIFSRDWSSDVCSSDLRLVPLWKQFAGAQEVRVMFGEERDEGAPEFPLILAISYPDRTAMERALASPARAQSRVVTGEITTRSEERRVGKERRAWVEA